MAAKNKLTYQARLYHLANIFMCVTCYKSRSHGVIDVSYAEKAVAFFKAQQYVAYHCANLANGGTRDSTPATKEELQMNALHDKNIYAKLAYVKALSHESAYHTVRDFQKKFKSMTALQIRTFLDTECYNMVEFINSDKTRFKRI